MRETQQTRFTPGEKVHVRIGRPAGHIRTPWYLRGKEGVVAEIVGTYRNPELLAYHKPGLPRRRLYRVRFAQSELWPGYRGPARDVLEADIFEQWLEPANKE